VPTCDARVFESAALDRISKAASGPEAGGDSRRRVVVGHTSVIQTPKTGSVESCGYELTDREWAACSSFLAPRLTRN